MALYSVCASAALAFSGCLPSNISVDQIQIVRIGGTPNPSGPLHEANAEGGGRGDSSQYKLERATVGGNTRKTQAATQHYRLKGGLVSGL